MLIFFRIKPQNASSNEAAKRLAQEHPAKLDECPRHTLGNYFFSTVDTLLSSKQQQKKKTMEKK